MKKYLLALAMLLLSPVAMAQCNGIFNNNTICGNVSGGPSLPGQVANNVLTGVPGGTNGQVQFNNNGVFAGTSNVLGVVANASGSATTTTGTITSGTSTLALASAIDFVNNQGIRIDHAGPAFAVNLPTGLTITPTGTTGSTQYSYTIASLDGQGGVGTAIASVQTSTGNATLSTTNYNKITWSAPASGPTPGGYAIYGRITGSPVLLAVVGGAQLQWNDFGTAAINPYSWLPTTPLVSSLASWLVTTISSGAGTTTLTLAATATTTATTQSVSHDDTAALQTAITAGSVGIPPGTYAVSSDIQVPSSRYIWLMKGATINDIGGRITAYVPNGGNINFRLDGIINFALTRDRTDNLNWDTGGVPLGGVIEMGGSITLPAIGISIWGTGEVAADYIWLGSPPTNYTNQNAQLFRKGLAMFYAVDVKIDGLNVHNMHGEAIYHQAGQGEFNVEFTRNHVHEVAFNGLNFNEFGQCLGCVMAWNYIQNAWQGIEASSGTIIHNYAFTNTNGLITGAGGGGFALVISDNVFSGSTTYGLAVTFNPTRIEDVQINGNLIHNPGAQGILVDVVSTFQLQNNTIYVWATTAAGAAITLGPSADRGYVDGNIMRGAGGFSTGNIINNGTNITLGTNPVF